MRPRVALNAKFMSLGYPRFSSSLIYAVALASSAPLVAQIVPEDRTVLPAMVILSTQVANQPPSGSFAMPVSGLRFEPRVDVQARNLAEGQADVSIRGGVFENTGFRIGATSLFDPQTGHYLAEIPVAPAMLESPVLLVGAENAILGCNANVGTVAYGWRRIEQRGEISAGIGEDSYNRQSFYPRRRFSGPPTFRRGS